MKETLPCLIFFIQQIIFHILLVLNISWDSIPNHQRLMFRNNKNVDIKYSTHDVLLE